VKMLLRSSIPGSSSFEGRNRRSLGTHWPRNWSESWNKSMGGSRKTTHCASWSRALCVFWSGNYDRRRA
jgi:hypothetical protein